jgi:hypothetical protein
MVWIFWWLCGKAICECLSTSPFLHPTLTWPLCNSDFNSNHYGRLAIDTRHEPIADACVSVFKSSIQPRQYKLKQQYFVGIPANEIPTISPISNMVDAQWCQLVDKWSNAHNKVISLDVPPNMYLWWRLTHTSLAGSFLLEQAKPGQSPISSSNRISLLRCTITFICKCQHASNVTFPFFYFLK